MCEQVIILDPLLNHLSAFCNHHYLHIHFLLDEIYHGLHKNILNYTCIFIWGFKIIFKWLTMIMWTNRSVIICTIQNKISKLVLEIKLEFLFWIYGPRYTNIPKHHICDKNSDDEFYCFIFWLINNIFVILDALDSKIIQYIFLIIIPIIPNTDLKYRK